MRSHAHILPDMGDIKPRLVCTWWEEEVSNLVRGEGGGGHSVNPSAGRLSLSNNT